MRFQIITNEGHGSYSYDYFDADTFEDAYQKAIITGNDLIEKGFALNEKRKYEYFFSPYKPKKTLKVVEYDTEKKGPKRGGHKFKLTLMYFKATYHSGAKVVNYWYEADVPIKEEVLDGE